MPFETSKFNQTKMRAPDGKLNRAERRRHVRGKKKGLGHAKGAFGSNPILKAKKLCQTAARDQVFHPSRTGTTIQEETVPAAPAPKKKG